MMRNSLNAICAVKFVRKMRGGSQSSLVEAEDGNSYIVKFAENPQGSQILLNEALGSELMGHLGFPVPVWRPIKVTSTFINRNPEVWFETNTPAHRRPPAGIHYGSRLVPTDADQSLYEFLPNSWYGRVSNRDNFLGLLLFDLWAKHRDNRQAVFLHREGSRTAQAVFIDHGHLFGTVPEGRESGQIRVAMFRDERIYDGLDIRSTLPSWEARIREIDSARLELLGQCIPPEWYTKASWANATSILQNGQAVLSEHVSRISTFFEANASSEEAGRFYENPESLRIFGSRIRLRTAHEADRLYRAHPA